jgi:hypothetical protein
VAWDGEIFCVHTAFQSTSSCHSCSSVLLAIVNCQLLKLFMETCYQVHHCDRIETCFLAKWSDAHDASIQSYLGMRSRYPPQIQLSGSARSKLLVHSQVANHSSIRSSMLRTVPLKWPGMDGQCLQVSPFQTFFLLALAVFDNNYWTNSRYTRRV